MAEFMQGAVAKTPRRRKAGAASETPNADRESSTTRTDDELAALVAQFHDVPRGQWPAEVLEYQRRQQREKKRSARAALEEEDRLRREVEQERRRQQLANDVDDDDDDEDVQQREASRRKARTKRARITVERAVGACPLT
jgi:hypothetical protein